jgi:hypothetical protein
VAEVAHALIENCDSCKNPLYDDHITDICLIALLLQTAGMETQLLAWLQQMTQKSFFAYRFGHWFPVMSNNYEDLLGFVSAENKDPKELTESLSIYAIIAEWFVILNATDAYEKLRKNLEEFMPHTNLQIWFPDENTNEFIYREYAAVKSGSCYSSITLPESVEEFREQILEAKEHAPTEACVSSINSGLSIITLMASRHYRTPVLPYFWQKNLGKSKSGQPMNGSNLKR